MVAKLESTGQMRTGEEGGHAVEREEISTWNPLSEMRSIDKC